MAPLHTSDISVVFIACPRNPTYLAQTLASFAWSDRRFREFREIIVSSDSENLDYVDGLTQVRGIRWIHRTEKENELAQSYQLHRRACYSYWRGMGCAQIDATGSNGARALLVFEDDVIFRNDWIGMLLDTLLEMRAACLNCFVLTLYSAREHEHPAFRRGKYYSSYVASEFYGTQAMFYPAEEISPIRDIIWNSGVESYEEPYDLLIKRRAQHMQHLYTTRHSLAQHSGRKSTGLGGHHYSCSFDRPWPNE